MPTECGLLFVALLNADLVKVMAEVDFREEPGPLDLIQRFLDAE